MSQSRRWQEKSGGRQRREESESKGENIDRRKKRKKTKRKIGVPGKKAKKYYKEGKGACQKPSWSKRRKREKVREDRQDASSQG